MLKINLFNLAARYRNTLFWGYIGILLLLAILPLNSSSNFALNNTMVIHIRLDHLLHGLVFLPYAFIARWIKGMNIPMTLISGLVVAAIMEGIQYFLTYRSFSINDMISNEIGFIAGSIILLVPPRYFS
ncbi:MAG: VanZ family protein [Bacteroidetes bacterium]|nr:VanZ family protein [Bacteroidota bacterium]